MRILHVLDHSIPVQDGYSYRTLAILREQAARGWQTMHLTGGKHGTNAALGENIEGLLFHRTPPPAGLRGRLPVYKQWAVIQDLERRLLEVAGNERPDIIHAHSPALNGVAAVNAGRRLGIPVVYEVRGFWEDAAVDLGTGSEGGLRYRASRALETWVFRRADHVTTICEGLRAEIESRGIPASRLTVIPNGADPDEFPPRGKPDPTLAKQLGLEGATVIGYIGSFYAYEGLHLVVEAMSKIGPEHGDVKALLVGGGLEDDRIRAEVAARGLGERVIMPGRVAHAEVPRYYDLLDVLVYPRVSMRLTNLVTPLKPLEAMARSQIVLASDVGGHRELVCHGETGYLFPPDDPAGLATAILDVLSRRAEWPLIQQAGRAYVRDERSWALSVARYEAIYDSLCRRTRA